MHKLGARWAISICTIASLWTVASCGDNDDNPAQGDGGEAGEGGAEGPSGAGGKSQAGTGGAAGGNLGQAGMEAEGGATSGTGGGPIGAAGTGAGGAGGVPGTDPGGAGGVPGTDPGGAGGVPGTDPGGAGGVPGTDPGGAGGDAGSQAGGAGGESGAEPTIVFDFEDGVQGFTKEVNDVTIATSAAHAVSGSQSLKVTLPGMTDTNRLVFADFTDSAGAGFWPGTVVELNVWLPEGDDDLYMQAFSFIDYYQWHAASSPPSPLVRGGWTTWTYTVPKTFPGGMQHLGIQFGAGGRAFAGGDVYVDAIATVGGVEACTGDAVTSETGPRGRREFDFETDLLEWDVDEQPADVALSLSDAQVLAGTSALKIALTAVPTGVKRKVRIRGPETFCGDTVTFNVWTPAVSTGLNVQAYMQYNNWDDSVWVSPDVINRGAYTEITLTVPGLGSTVPVGPGGYQALGIEIWNDTGAPFTGDVYLDDVSW